MLRGIEPTPASGIRLDPDELGHRRPVTGHQQLVLALQHGFGVRPALPKVTDADRLHG